MAGARNRVLKSTNSRGNLSTTSQSITRPSIQSDQSDMNTCLAFPIPDIPHDGPLQFEIIMFAYSVVALLLQYVHLYRTVWWLPHSYNNYALNFYLIDPWLIAFSSLLLGRRVMWNIERKFINCFSPSSWIQSITIVARSLTTFAILLALLYMAYIIMQKHPVVNMLYLAYPVSVYFLLFGLSGEPFLELTPNVTPNSRIKIIRDRSGVYKTSAASSIGNTSTPEQVRNEVAFLKTNFNMRLKQVLFNSIVSAYYAAFIPCCFAQSALHYDIGWVGRHVLLVWIGCFTLYVVQCFPSAYNHMLHRTALHLGQWTKMEGRVSPTFYSQWSGSSFWSMGQIVRHGRDIYKAEGVTNAAEPGNNSQSRFYTVFRDPSLAVCALLVIQSGLVLAQHLSLTWSSQWYQLISESILLFANYYALFKLTRDYLVLWRIYMAESLLQSPSKEPQ